MKLYRGTRAYSDADLDGVTRGEKMRGACVVTVENDEVGEDLRQRKKLSSRLDLWNHSPSGFEWSYSGAGPAQLALAILADCLGDGERAVRLHQRFKAAVVANLPDEEWTLSEEQVRQAIIEIEREARK